MTEYTIELINAKGNTFRDGKRDIVRTRKEACRLIKERGYKDSAIIYEYYGGMYSRQMRERAYIFYDPANDQYPPRKAGFYGNVYTYKDGKKISKRYRISAKTGELLDFNKEWRFL